MAKKIIKYAIITVCGVILFIVVNQASNAERPAPSVGGEIFFLILPVMWWLTEKAIKDIRDEFKRMWREINSEIGDTPQEREEIIIEVTWDELKRMRHEIKSESGDTPQEHKQITMEVTKDD